MARTYNPRYEFPEEDRELVEKWLKSHHSKATQNAYFFGLANFKKWYQQPLESWLSLQKHQWMQTALSFQAAQVEESKRNNTILTALRALSSFTYYHKAETFNLRKQRLNSEMDVTSHIFRNGDLIKMYEAGDLQEKAIVATFCSLGWEFSAVLGFDRKNLESLLENARVNGEKYIFIEGQRKKTGVPRYSALSPVAIDALTNWLKFWKGETVFRITTKAGLNDCLKTLAKKAGILATGSIHSHLFRKWVMDQLSDAQWNIYQIHLYVGKRIPTEDATYLRSLRKQIIEKFPPTFEKYLNLKPERIVEVIDKQRVDEIGRLKDQINDLAVMIFTLAGNRNPKMKEEVAKFMRDGDRERLERAMKEEGD
jgi:integrase